MAKPSRGLPDDFSLSLPDNVPVTIGDFLEEEPPPLPVRKTPPRPQPQPVVERFVPAAELREEVVRENREEQRAPRPVRPVPRNSQQPSVIRYQLNLTNRTKQMLEELVEHVCTYSPESDARVSEVFQAIIALLHNAKEELELSALPRRGAWGSVTAKNFPGALSKAFEQAILQAARKRGALE